MVLEEEEEACHGLLGDAGIVLYPILTLWTFFGMSFVAEEYFSVALDGLVTKYAIPDAVAGATILAVGTSFPELIIGFVSQFLSAEPEPSITLGVTLGSAIFNQLAIVGACALVAPGGALVVSWRAMLRDVLVWTATIALATGLMADGVVTTLDGWLMVGFYAVYVLLCGFWSKIDALLLHRHPHLPRSWLPPARIVRMILPRRPRDQEAAVYVPANKHKQHLADCHEDSERSTLAGSQTSTETERGEEEGGGAKGAIGEAPAPLEEPLLPAEKPAPKEDPAAVAAASTALARSLRKSCADRDDFARCLRASCPNQDEFVRAFRESCLAEVGAARESVVEKSHHFDDDHGPLGGPFPPDFWHRVKYVCQAPFSVFCYAAQLPRLRRHEIYEVLALVAGTIVACISYFMVQWLELSACLLGVPVITLSLLFVASGTCLPELVVAMVVARKGLGTAAVSTALGSNIFDILLALGLPWAIYASAVEPVYIDSTLVLTCIMAASTAFFLLLSLTNKWIYSKWHGYAMLAFYFLFNVYVILDAIPALNIGGITDQARSEPVGLS